MPYRFLNGLSTGRQEYVITVRDNEVLILLPILEIILVVGVLSLQIIGKL